MKLLRKIAPLAITCLFLGTTVAAADLGSWKSSFPGTDTAIVIGSNAAAQDTIGAVDIANALGVSQGGSAPVAGAHLIDAPGNDLEILETFGDVDNILDDGDLPTLLAEGKYRESRGETENEVAYTQQLVFDDTGVTNLVTFDANEEDDETATHYIFLDDGVEAFTYELEFEDTVEYDGTDADTIAEDFELTKIKILGREYTIVDASEDGANVVDELTLMAGAVKASQWEYSKASYTLGNKTYEVEAKIISDDDSTAILVVNGEETDEMEEGDTYTLEDGTRIGVVDVVPNEGAEKSTGTAEGNDLVTFYLGAEKILLPGDGGEVEINGEPVDGSTCVFDAIADELDGIIITQVPDDNVYIAAGKNWVEPILGRFKFDFQGLVKTTETITLTNDGDEGEIKLNNNDEKELSIPLVFDEVNEESYFGDEISDGTYEMTAGGNTATAGNGGNMAIQDNDACDGGAAGDLTDCEGTFFIAVTAGGEAHIIEIKDIDLIDGGAGGEVVFKDITEDKLYDEQVYTGGADDFDLNFMEITATFTEGGNGNIAYGNINDYDAAAYFQTELSGNIELFFDGAVATVNVLNTEDQLLGGDIDFETDGALVAPEMVLTVDETNLFCGAAGASCALEDDSDYDVAVDDGTTTTDGFSWGAYFKWNEEDDTEVVIEYPEEQVAAKAFVSEILTTIPELGQTGGTGAATPVLDTEITDVKDKNLIIIGGSGINKVAAEALKVTFPTYGSDSAWTNATGVDAAGKAVVKLMDSPYTTGKFAMLVAGWEGVDTARASKVLKEGTPALSGQKVLLNTATSTVTVITA